MSINVLIVDDSALVRKFLSEIVESDRSLNLVGTANDPIFALEKLKKSLVDVILLDIEMPRMDGLTFLEKLMKVRPTPVIILSSLTEKKADITLRAFEIGAFDVLKKPENMIEFPGLRNNIVNVIKSAGKSNVGKKLDKQYQKKDDALKPVTSRHLFTTSRSTTDKIIAIGSSTGGTTAIFDILSTLPVDIPGIVIVQHMPLKFSEAFASRLNGLLNLTVKVAEDGDRIQNGFVYIAPGEIHCSIKVSGAKFHIKLQKGPRVNYHKPSVEILFNSVAKYAGKNAVGVMLTGMGEDGSMAMKNMKDAGCFNIIQDEDSSVVWGMPGKAVEYGAADVILPLNEISDKICSKILESLGGK